MDRNPVQVIRDVNEMNKRLAKEMMEVRPDFPGILCTGYSERISDDEAKEMGIKAYAMIPLIKKDLAKTVRKVLDQK